MTNEPATLSVAIMGGERRRKVVVVTGNAEVILQEFGFQVFHEEMNNKKELGLICASLYKLDFYYKSIFFIEEVHRHVLCDE